MHFNIENKYDLYNDNTHTKELEKRGLFAVSTNSRYCSEKKILLMILR